MSTRKWDKSKLPIGPFVLNKDCPQAQGLVAWYPMTMAHKNYVPDLVNKFHLVPGTAPDKIILSSDGAPVLSLTAASNQYLRCGSTPLSNWPATLAAWFMMEGDIAANGSARMLSLSQESTIGIMDLSIQKGATQLFLQARSQAAGVSGAGQDFNYASNTWLHGVATFTGQNTQGTYLNGSNTGDTQRSTAGPASQAVTAVNMGGVLYNVSSTTNHFNGQIGESGIWNVVLDAKTVYRLYSLETRYELYYPLRSRKWFSSGAGIITTTVIGKLGQAAQNASTKIASQAITGRIGQAAQSASTKIASQAITGIIGQAAQASSTKVASQAIIGKSGQTAQAASTKVASQAIIGKSGQTGQITAEQIGAGVITTSVTGRFGQAAQSASTKIASQAITGKIGQAAQSARTKIASQAITGKIGQAAQSASTKIASQAITGKIGQAGRTIAAPGGIIIPSIDRGYVVLPENRNYLVSPENRNYSISL